MPVGRLAMAIRRAGMDPVLKQTLQEYGSALHRTHEDADPWVQWIQGKTTEELQLVLDHWQWPERLLQKDLVMMELEQRRRGSPMLEVLFQWLESPLRRLSAIWFGKSRRPRAGSKPNQPHENSTP